MAQELDLLDGLDIVLPDEPGAAIGEFGAAAQGTFFGPYQLLQEVGAGGVAKVMRARHIHPHYADHMFAVKVLHENLSRDPKVVALFRREAYVLALLKHPNVVQTFEAGLQDNKLFIAMEYIDGRDLDNMLARCLHAKLTLPLAIPMHIMGEVIAALDYAHNLRDVDGNRLNLIHRDVNPANVFVSFDGRVKLGDFGVASITAGQVEKSRELAGKIGYFAPEQLSGDGVDHRADLFAIGVMMFEMLCGERLFEADDADKALRLNKRAKIPKPSKLNPNLPAGLERIMLRALERRPADRFASGAEMLEALRPFLPARAGMDLAVASLMRRLFLNEHMQELQLREGLSGRAAPRGQGQQVCVFTRDERARAAFGELFLSRGYHVRHAATLPALQDELAAGRPDVVLCDLTMPGLAPKAVAQVVGRSTPPPPVVAVSTTFDVADILAADALGASDLLFKPFSVERALTAVRGAILGMAKTQRHEAQNVPRQYLRLLFITGDARLGSHVTNILAPMGYHVSLAASTVEALQRIEVASPQAVIIDVLSQPTIDRLFVAQLRAAPGVSMMPVVFLLDDPARATLGGLLVERTRAISRDASTLELRAALDGLREDTRSGRTFLRYDAEFPAELRYGGRVFSAVAVNLSRGGVSLECEHIPPVGTEVSVVMRLPVGRSAVEAGGQVLRVGLVKRPNGEAAQMGIEFHRLAAAGEADLIATIRLLENGPGVGTAVIDDDALARR